MIRSFSKPSNRLQSGFGITGTVVGILVLIFVLSIANRGKLVTLPVSEQGVLSFDANGAMLKVATDIEFRRLTLEPSSVEVYELDRNPILVKREADFTRADGQNMGIYLLESLRKSKGEQDQEDERLQMVLIDFTPTASTGKLKLGVARVRPKEKS